MKKKKLDLVEEINKKSQADDQLNSQNKFHKLCGDSYVHFRNWKCMEWVLFSVYLILGMYAVGGISGNVIDLDAWENAGTVNTTAIQPIQIYIEIAAQVVLLEAVIFGFVYLHLLRNLLGFVLAMILLVLSGLFFIGIMLNVLRLIVHEESFQEEMRSNLKQRMNKKIYEFEFEIYQEKYQCCGVANYKDWSEFKALEIKDSVPPSCCKKSIQGLDRLNCGLKALVKPESEVKKTINTRGCATFMGADYKKAFIQILVENEIVIILIVAAVVFVFLIFRRWYRKKHHKPIVYEDPREQENDAESDIIPGTPMKSYISSSQQIYYAP